MEDTPHILLINPWIHDFAAYDFWAKPLGLLQLASILRSHGFGVSYVDCLDRHHPRMPGRGERSRDGRGPYLKTPIAHPPGLADVRRTYSRYGIKISWLKESLSGIQQPDLILVTSLMTYWYPGVGETIQTVRETFGRTPVVLGGIYASLCRRHAEKRMDADRVIAGPGELRVLELAREYTGFSTAPLFDARSLDTYPYPAYDLQSRIDYVPLLTSKGCPYRCSYCASSYLQPQRLTRSPESVIAEIAYWHRKHGVVDFAFYDDALLVDAENHMLPVLEGIIRSGLALRFHTPNALHVREISRKAAVMMRRAGFKTIRLGIETADFDNRKALDAKVSAEEFARGVRRLRSAGFQRSQIGAYLLVGLPNQSVESVADSIQIVKDAGILPVLAHYSPIPHTPMWPSAAVSSRYELEADPIFTNNAAWPCSREPFSWQTLSKLKILTKQ